MTPGNISIGFILACVFVGSMAVLGLFTLFVQAENIERNVLVGLLTLGTAFIAMALLQEDYRTDFRFGMSALISISLVSAMGFAVGRILDAVLGPRETLETPKDADLAE